MSRRGALLLMGGGAAALGSPLALRGTAGAVAADELETAIRSYMRERIGSANPGAAGVTRSGMSTSTFRFERERSSYLRSLGQRFDWNGTIRRWSSTVTDVQVSVDDTGAADVTLYETMKLAWVPNERPLDPQFQAQRDASPERYDVGKPSGGVTVVSEFGTPHAIRLERAGSGWTVVDDTYFEQDLLGDSPSAAAAGPVAVSRLQAVRDRRAKGRRPADRPRARARKDPAYDIYAWQQACEYAYEFALSYNPNYVHYNCSGGDCANFVSQSLWAGNQLPAGNWNRVKTSSCGATNKWGGAAVQWYNNQYLRTWVINQGRGGNASGITALGKGDIVNYDWTANGSTDHVTILTNAASFLVCSHNNDRRNVAWQMGNTGSFKFTAISEHY